MTLLKELSQRDARIGDLNLKLGNALAEIERLRAALKPFADEVDMLALHGSPPPRERMLMYASEGGGTFLGISVSALYDAHRAFEQLAQGTDG